MDEFNLPANIYGWTSNKNEMDGGPLREFIPITNKYTCVFRLQRGESSAARTRFLTDRVSVYTHSIRWTERLQKHRTEFTTI